MIWRQICRPIIDVVAILVLNDDLRDFGNYLICKPEIFVSTFLYLSDSEFVSLLHVVFE
jgi:hypothetical protein